MSTAAPHEHGRSHDGAAQPHEGHSHEGHSHEGDAHDGPAFDWDAAAASIELDASVMSPVVEGALARVELPAGGRLLDLGSGPGVVATLLAQRAPGAQVVAADGSQELLARAAARAEDGGVGDRVSTRQVDLDRTDPAALPSVLTDGGAPFDLVWASMVLHHVDRHLAVLAALRDALRPGGTLVVVEMGGPLEIFADDTEPFVRSGAWAQWSQAHTEVIRAHLPEGAMDLRWDDALRDAGFVDVVAEEVVVDHPSPLGEDGRQWLAWRLADGSGRVGDRLPEEVRAEVARLVDPDDERSVLTRPDVRIRTSRTVIVGRRPARSGSDIL